MKRLALAALPALLLTACQDLGSAGGGADALDLPEVADGTLSEETMKRVTERFPGVNQYVIQVQNFCNAVRNGAAYPCPLEFSRGTQRMIDMTFAAHGA